MSNIILHNIKFGNMFSYGDNNVFILDKNTITQIDAINGSGKSSLLFIIQELLFNKNIKGIKKGDIANRHLPSKNWNGEINFSADDKQYKVTVVRTGATSKVSLVENGVDVSEHKVLDTYKKISEILGMSFETFSQLTYQSSTDLLDFLKATDTNRKKFLISLFNLEKYITIGEVIKAKVVTVDKEVALIQNDLKTIEAFISNVSIPKRQEELPELATDSSIAVRLSEVTKELSNIADTCKKIDKNNMYIRERDSLLFDISLEKPKKFQYADEYAALKHDLTILLNDINKLEASLKNLKVIDKCPSCGQALDSSHTVKMREDTTKLLKEKKEIYSINLESAEVWGKEQRLCDKLAKEYSFNQNAINRFEQLAQLVDKSIPVAYPDYAALTEEKNQLIVKQSEQSKEISRITEHNKLASANNAKIQALIEQKADFLIRQSVLEKDILIKSSQLAALNILKKAFSTTGIVAFKLENLTKELENTINDYLAQLSDGQFQLEFSLDKEKLNINIIDNGVSAPIETTSGGELNRIQMAVLLAIRNLLSKLGGNSINLLFLDETTGVLDDDGKDKLVEVLQKETSLNVFLVSHDFDHPLVEKVNIIKEDKISRIQG